MLQSQQMKKILSFGLYMRVTSLVHKKKTMRSPIVTTRRRIAFLLIFMIANNTARFSKRILLSQNAVNSNKVMKEWNHDGLSFRQILEARDYVTSLRK